LVELWHAISKAGIVEPMPRVAALLQLYRSLVLYFGLPPLQKMARAVGELIDVGKQWKLISPLSALEAMTGALQPTGAQSVLKANLSLTDVDKVLITSTTDLTTQQQATFFVFPSQYISLEAVFCKEEPQAVPFSEDNFPEAVRASGAIPGAFAPVTLPLGTNRDACVDGGVTNNTPIGQAVHAGADDITIVYVDPEIKPSRQLSTNIVEILMGCYSMMQQCILDLDYTTALRVNDAVGANAEDAKEKRIIRLRKFRPDAPLAPGIIDFDKQALIDQAFATGQADARNAVKRNGWAS
ncbi:MAG: patatin-like phospholipase family protein, partial [Vulcanimicrobiaceae bacterium]